VRRLAAVLWLAVAALVGCGGGEEAGQRPSTGVVPETASQEKTAQPGGTLRVALVHWADHEAEYAAPDGSASYALDPQAEYDNSAWELFRCCLQRTLLSYNGKPTAEGGADLRPDLAADMPTVSLDGLTWTFRLKLGLHYAPPYENSEIVAADVIRGVERTLRPAPPSYAKASGHPTIGAYAFYYSPLIAGAEAFADGKADTISGLETPDDHTLVVHLTQASGDLGHRFSLPATAPIPPGAADGHDDGYGPYLVASGPYMLGTYEPGSSITLVRNPSWAAASDELRAAYADRIELTFEADANAAHGKVENGDLDLVLDAPAPQGLADRYRSDSASRSRLLVVPLDSLLYTAMNLAQPPFDDEHVRRAANLVVDKAAVLESFGPGGGRIATHLALDSLEDNLLLDYDPFSTTDHRGDLAAARTEMAASRYDTDADGICDRPACSHVPAVDIAYSPEYFPRADLSLLVQRDLARLGIELDVRSLPPRRAFPALSAQKEPYAVVLDYGWIKDFPNGSGWFSPTLTTDDGSLNPSLVGVAPDQLGAWGYPVTSVPSATDEITGCLRLVGGAQTQCWAQVDQLVMEQIVPWIPIASPNDTRIVSPRVASVSIDQLTTLLSLDRIALEPDS
jgi:peptide/nickel transport system substrate-binding protein